MEKKRPRIRDLKTSIYVLIVFIASLVAIGFLHVVQWLGDLLRLVW